MTNRKLAIILGPYRNLSTLTAATLALHPAIQVLNHAAERLWGIPGLDLLRAPDDPTYDQFMEAAWTLSGGGSQGIGGGSILHSHAFDSPLLQSLYRDRFGDQVVKSDAQWLVWKDSMRIQNRLMSDPELFDRLCDNFPQLRFVLPLRDPLDCATSNAKTGHSPTLMLSRDAPIEEVLEVVLDAFAWGLDKREQRPDRVFAFTQHEPAETLLPRLADFLDIDAGAEWLEDGRQAFVVRDRYQFAPESRAYARSRIVAKLGRWPDYAAVLADGVSGAEFSGSAAAS